MKRYMEHTTGNSFVAILCGSMMALINNIFDFNPLFIGNIPYDAVKAIVVGFLGAMSGLLAKSVHAYMVRKIKGWMTKKPKAL